MRSTSALPALMLAGALLLTGCGGGDDGTAEASGNGSGPGSGSGSSSTNGSSGDEPTSNDSGDGSDQPQVDLGSLPDGFPEDDVPLTDGQIITAVGMPGDNGGFGVTLAVGGSFEDAFDDAIGELEDSGFTVKRRDKLGEFDAAQLESADYLVVVSGGESNGQAALTYTVTPTQ